LGNGVVQSIIYQINGSGSCTLASSAVKLIKWWAIRSPRLREGTRLELGTEVNDVLTNPIFLYYKADGTQIPNTSLPVDISTSGGPQILASIKTIKISLTIRNNSVIDRKTSQAIETNFEGEVSINNCSMATTGRRRLPIGEHHGGSPQKKTGGAERGVALVIALLVLLLITAVGMGMIFMSNTETNVSANFRDEQTAYFAAKAGIEEVRDRLRAGRGGQLAASHDAGEHAARRAQRDSYVINPWAARQSPLAPRGQQLSR